MSEELIIDILSEEKEIVWQALVNSELRIQELSEDYVRIEHLIRRAEEIERDSWRAKVKRLLGSSNIEHKNRISRLKERQAEVVQEATELDLENQKLKDKLTQMEYESVNSPMILAIRGAVWERIKKNFDGQAFASELRVDR